MDLFGLWGRKEYELKCSPQEVYSLDEETSPTHPNVCQLVNSNNHIIHYYVLSTGLNTFYSVSHNAQTYLPELIKLDGSKVRIQAREGCHQHGHTSPVCSDCFSPNSSCVEPSARLIVSKTILVTVHMCARMCL